MSEQWGCTLQRPVAAISAAGNLVIQIVELIKGDRINEHNNAYRGYGFNDDNNDVSRRWGGRVAVLF